MFALNNFIVCVDRSVWCIMGRLVSTGWYKRGGRGGWGRRGGEEKGTEPSSKEEQERGDTATATCDPLHHLYLHLHDLYFLLCSSALHYSFLHVCSLLHSSSVSSSSSWPPCLCQKHFSDCERGESDPVDKVLSFTSTKERWLGKGVRRHLWKAWLFVYFSEKQTGSSWRHVSKKEPIRTHFRPFPACSATRLPARWLAVQCSSSMIGRFVNYSLY